MKRGTDMRAWIVGGIVAGVAALGLAACGTGTNNAADTASTTAPTTTAVVTQVVTKTVKTAAARPRKAKPKPKPAPAPAPTTTSGPATDGPIMPDVVGKDLDAATGELDSEGIQYALNSNGKHVILRFDWGVCSTSPAAGQAATGVVVLNVGHFSCGA
jgi:hypothetical protein